MLHASHFPNCGDFDKASGLAKTVEYHDLRPAGRASCAHDQWNRNLVGVACTYRAATPMPALVDLRIVHRWICDEDMAVLKIGPSVHRWEIRVRYDEDDRTPCCEKQASGHARQLLTYLAKLHDIVPWEHVPVRALGRVGADARGIVRRELPEAFEADALTRQRFGDCLVAMAREIEIGREKDASARRKNARLARQYGFVPVGTVLVDRHDPLRGGILIDRPAGRTRHGLTNLHFGGNRTGGLVIGSCERRRYRLPGPDDIPRLPREHLSNHEILMSIRTANALRERCPDLF